MRVFLWMLTGVVAIVAIICVAVYTPVVQQFSVEKVSDIVARKTGIRISVEEFRMRFPINVSVHGARVVMPAGDTLAEIGAGRFNAVPWPLFRGRVLVTDIALDEARIGWRDTVSGMTIRARIDNLAVGGAALDPSTSTVRLTRAVVDGGDGFLFLGDGQDSTPQADTLPFDWDIGVKRLEIRDFAFAMDMAADLADDPGATDRAAKTGLHSPQNAPAARGDNLRLVDDPRVSDAAFDYRHIRIEEAGAVIRDLSYRAGGISARFEDLRLTEHSGLRVEEGNGDFAMTEKELSLTDLVLHTAESQLKGSFSAGAGITDADPATPLSMQISARLATGEIALFAPFPEQFAHLLKGRTVTLDGTVGGTLDDVSIDNVTARLAPEIMLRGHGALRSVTAPEKLSGSLTLEGELTGLDFAKSLIADTALRHRVAFPRRMNFRAAAGFTSESYHIENFTLLADKGRLEGKALYAPRTGSYRADVRLKDFPIAKFLPHDSLGVATLAIEAGGRGFDPVTMETAAALKVDRLDVRGYDLGPVTADVSASGGNIAGKIKNRSDLLAADVTLDARIARDTMPTSHRPAPLSYTLEARLDSVEVRLDTMRYRMDPATLRASASLAGTVAALRSGDLVMDVSSPLPPDSLIRSTEGAGGEIRRQLAARHFNADSLQNAFPGMTLTARAGRNNFLSNIARLRGFDFGTFSAGVSTVAGEPFRLEVIATGLSAGNLTVDTLDMTARRNGNMLDYELRLANRPTMAADIGLIRVSGSAGSNSITANVLQRNQQGETGFDFSLTASLAHDNAVRARIMPDPILGYEQWKVGAADDFDHPTEGSGDWIEYGTGGRLHADLHLASAGKESVRRELKPSDMLLLGSAWSPAASAAIAPARHIAVTSASLPDIPEGALRFTAHGLDLEGMLDLFPTAPSVGGLLSSDLTFGFRTDDTGAGIIAVKGLVGAKDFAYNSRRVADIDADLDFGTDASGRMALDGSVMLDKLTALTAKGSYAVGEMDFMVAIPALPLAVVQRLLPPETAILSGNLDGALHVTGPPSKPILRGDAGFTDGRAEIGMIGTAFGISPERITVADDRVTFRNIGLVAPNGQKLTVSGDVNIANLYAPTVDVSLRARDFQFVKSTHIGGSQVYGTAALDARITARGALDAMRVRGDVDLSEDTDIVYILRGGAQKVRDEKQHVVRFIPFADSLAVEESAAAAFVPGGGIDVLLGVAIGDGLKATVSLDELNENRVELLGGGDLAFSMNRQGDSRLSGRYTLSGGTVYYKPPVIPQKIFFVSDGSYVEWAGEVMEPVFNVTAIQTTDVRLEGEDGTSSDVAFDISVDIAGSLKTMDMSFDVSAPTNIAIQDQLLAMSPEMRMQQALTLMAYGQYTGPGYSSKGVGIDARKQLNDFVSKEINQWARNNLRGVDFSMGIDTRSDDLGDSRTDYSYNVSKTLFSDRVKISIGGRVSDQETSSEGLAAGLLEDVTLEYRLTERDNMFLKLYRYNTRESILEGEVTETGAGFVIRKKINRLGDIFRRTRPRRVGTGIQDNTRRSGGTERPFGTRGRSSGDAGERGGRDGRPYREQSDSLRTGLVDRSRSGRVESSNDSADRTVREKRDETEDEKR